RRPRPVRRHPRLHRRRRPPRARDERRGAHPRRHRAGPRLRGVARVRHPRERHGPRAVRRRAPHRLPAVRAAGRCPMNAVAFTTTTRLGEVTLEPVDPDRDAPLVQGWLAHPSAAYWQMGHLDVAQVRDYLAGVRAAPHEDAWLGRLDGDPVLLAETYDPARVLLVDVHDAQPGDLGMHLLVAPPVTPRHGLTDAVMTAVMRFCLTDEGRGAARVVVEPDVGNRRIAAKNAAAGFRVLREVDLGQGAHAKRAALSVATRADFAASPLGTGPRDATHLVPAHTEHAHRHLAAKTIAELTHERLLTPVADGPTGHGAYRLD